VKKPDFSDQIGGARGKKILGGDVVKLGGEERRGKYLQREMYLVKEN